MHTKLLELPIMYGVKKKDRITETICLLRYEKEANSYARSLSAKMKRRFINGKGIVH